MRIILIALLFLLPNLSNAQSFEGKYFGDFLDSENLITIERKKGQFITTVLTSTKTSFVLDSELANGVLIFSVPLYEKGELEVKGVLVDEDLELSFFMEGSQYVTTLRRLGKKTKLEDVRAPQMELALDERLIGKWLELERYSSDGRLAKDSKASKAYYQIFTSDGRIIIDPRKFRDADESNGFDFSYADIPNFRWKMKGRDTIISSAPGLMEWEEKYILSGDSLTLINDRGFKVFFIRDSKN